LNRLQGAAIPSGKKTAVSGWRDELVAGKGIGLFLFFSVQAIALDEDFLPAMLENMPGFMEESEPEVVVALVTQA